MITLYPHQKAALSKMHNGCILIGGTGSGKTLTALIYVYTEWLKGQTPLLNQEYIPKQKNIPVYVITTARKRDTLDWVKEAANVPLKLDSVDSWNNIQNYSNVKNAIFIFDEQRVVGSGVWVKSFLKIAKCNKWFLLSATPADRWMDLVPIFIANGFYKNRTEFLRRHVVFSRFSKFPKVERYLEVSRLIRLRDSVYVDMHFQKKTVPHKISIVCDFDKEKERILSVDRWDFYKDEPIQDISQYCYLLRRLVNSDQSRLHNLEKLILDHPKMIVFYNFNYELELLQNFAKDYGITFAEWNGNKHELIPSSNKWLYFVQYMAGAEGWNCIETDTVVFYSLNYSYRLMKQAEGRTDRLNTPFINLYYYYFTSDSIIDKAIGKVQVSKKSFNERRYISF